MHNAMESTSLSLGEQLKQIRLERDVKISDLAKRTRLSRLTIAAAEGKSDPKLSTMMALLEELGYDLIPVPKAIKGEVTSFIKNGGQVVTLPAGVTAPLGVAQSAFSKAVKNRLDDGS